MFCLLARPASASVLINQGGVSAQAGAKLEMTLTTTAGYYDGAGRVVFYNSGNQILAEESFYAPAGTHSINISVLCGVEQPSMNVVRYEIYNDTPFYLSASGSVSGQGDSEVAGDAGNGIGSASQASEASGGRTVFGSLAAVGEGNPEDGKYWSIHLEKGETLRTSGWGISGNSTSGATLYIEVLDQSSGQWNYYIDGVAAYGKAKFGGGAFTAPAAGNYAMRARCVTTRMCKFMIQINISGRRITPFYGGSECEDCGTDNLPVELSQGREQSEFGSDIGVANPIGPDVSFGRRWREVLALQRVGSPGLARGWMHSYDIRVLGSHNYDLQIQFSDGAQETWTAVLDANGNPTGELKPPSGAPYRVQGVVNPVQTNPADDVIDKRWSAVELTWDDGSKWSFVPGLLRYSYQLDRQFNATGQYLQFTYGTRSNDGALQTISNQNGTALLTLNYDGAFLANVTDVYGRRIAYTWAQPAGLPKVVLTGVSTIHAVGASALTYQQYQYWPYAAEDDKPLLKTIITRSPNGGDGVTTAYNSYDAEARVASTTDGNGNLRQYSYLPGETFIAVKNSGGMTVQVWTRYYDAQGRDTGHADASLNRWTIYYDDGRNPYKATRAVDPVGRTTSITYDVYGHVTSVTSPRGVTQFSYWDYTQWSLGRRTQTQTRGSDGTLRPPTSYSFNEPSGLLNTVIYPHPSQGGGMLSSSLTYDGYGNPLSITEPGENVVSRTTTFNYTQDGNTSRPMFVGRPLTVTDALGHTTHFRYDARGNLTSTMDAVGIVTDTEYDLSDQTTRMLLPASAQTGSGRGQVVNTYAYTGGPLRWRKTYDESGAEVRAYNYAYGNEGELKTQFGSNISQSVEYDAMYRMIRFQDGNSNPTNYYYDGNGRLTATAYPNANSTTGYDMERTTAFDNSGLPLQTVDGRGVVSNLAYETDGSPSGVSYPASPGENVSLRRDVFGQVNLRSDASGIEQYAYNYVGNLLLQITQYKGQGEFEQTVQQHRSGALSRLSSGLGNVNYAYDAAGRLTTMVDPDGAPTTWSYADNDWLMSQTLSIGTTTALTRNALGQLTSQRNANNANTTLSSWGHPSDATQKQLYNAVGQLTRSTATATPSFNWGGTTSYAYDNQSQLTQEASSRGTGYTHSFGYSGAGNPLVWKGVNRAYNSDNQEVNRSQPVAYAYDGAGNTTQLKNYNLATPTTAAPTQKLVYNAQGQLSELRDASNAVIATYVYRGDGKRAWKELANGTRTYFYYMGEKLTATSDGVILSGLVLWGADGIVGYRNGNDATRVLSRFYNLYDPQGNLAQTLDANGNVISQSAVSAWGEPLRDANGNQAGGGYGAKFGYVRDGESGFYLCTLRYYDPSAGRWITRDPIGYAGGSNLYGYVGNDPVNNGDPSGLAPRPKPSADDGAYHLYFGPSGGYGWMRIYKDHELVAAFKASNVTEDPNGNRNKRGKAPAPPGRYWLNPGQRFSSEPNRPSIYVQTPGTGRSGIFIHSVRPGTKSGWYPTEGCIRVWNNDRMRWLERLLKGKKAWIEIQDTDWDGKPEWEREYPERRK